MRMESPLRVEAYGRSVQGGRASNEDAFTLLDAAHPIVRARRRGSLYAVADGLGGHAGGAEAAQIAVEMLASFFDTVRELNGSSGLHVLRAVVEEAHLRIRDRASENPTLEGMGTTLTAALFRGRRVAYVHVGDSRFYRLRAGRLELLTEDQSVAFQLRRAGTLTDSEYRESPLRHSLVSYLGADQVSFQEGETEARLGDRFLLATDGLVKLRRDASLLVAGRRSSTPRQWVEDLLSRPARARDGDNATAVAVFVGEASGGRV